MLWKGARIFVKFEIILILLLVGGLLVCLNACGTQGYERDLHEVAEDFHSLSIDTNTGDISILPAEDGVCRVAADLHKHETLLMDIEDGVLQIGVQDERHWYERSFAVHRSAISVYLPKTEYAALSISEHTGDVKIAEGLQFDSADISVTTGDVVLSASVGGLLNINGSTGNVEIRNVSLGGFYSVSSTGDILLENVISTADVSIERSTGLVSLESVRCEGNLSVQVTTGRCEFADVTCRELDTIGSTGRLEMRNTIAWERMSVERTSGRVNFDCCDAAEIYVTTGTGDVKGNLKTDKVFIVRTDTGKIDVPKTIVGGRCEITTTTGDIKISVS